MEKSFSISKAIAFGWNKFKENAVILIGSFLIMGVISFVFDSSRFTDSPMTAFGVWAIGFILSSLVSLGLVRITLKIAEDKGVNFKDLIGEAHLLVTYIIAQILSTLAIGLGLVLFIIPGIIAGLGLMFVQYVIVDKELGAIDALKESWKMTKGYKFKLLLFVFALVALNILGAIALMVGLLVTAPISIVATAYVYKKLSGEGAEESADEQEEENEEDDEEEADESDEEEEVDSDAKEQLKQNE